MPLVESGTRHNAIAAGSFQTFAPKADGTVVAWGSNLDIGGFSAQSTAPTGMRNVVGITAGWSLSAALIAEPAPTPTLQVALAGNDVVLSWPTSVQNFSLQATTNLTDPGSWTTLPNAPLLVDQQHSVNDPLAGPKRFYRLKHQ